VDLSYGWGVVSMEYDAILYIYWDSVENIFYDHCGFEMVNVLDVATPNDIFLFRERGFRTFHHRDNRRILCEILTDDQTR